MARDQLLEVNGSQSREGLITGLPRGTVHVPQLFVFYINDNKSACHLVLHADDSTLLVSQRQQDWVGRPTEKGANRYKYMVRGQNRAQIILTSK